MSIYLETATARSLQESSPMSKDGIYRINEYRPGDRITPSKSYEITREKLTASVFCDHTPLNVFENSDNDLEHLQHLINNAKGDKKVMLLSARRRVKSGKYVFGLVDDEISASINSFIIEKDEWTQEAIDSAHCIIALDYLKADKDIELIKFNIKDHNDIRTDPNLAHLNELEIGKLYELVNTENPKKRGKATIGKIIKVAEADCGESIVKFHYNSNDIENSEKTDVNYPNDGMRQPMSTELLADMINRGYVYVQIRNDIGINAMESFLIKEHELTPKAKTVIELHVAWKYINEYKEAFVIENTEVKEKNNPREFSALRIDKIGFMEWKEETKKQKSTREKMNNIINENKGKGNERER